MLTTFIFVASLGARALYAIAGLWPGGAGDMPRALIEGHGGLQRDPEKALRLIRLSSFRGNPLGKFYYGEILAAGVLAPKDVGGARKLFEEARDSAETDPWIKRRAEEALRTLQEAK